MSQRSGEVCGAADVGWRRGMLRGHSRRNLDAAEHTYDLDQPTDFLKGVHLLATAGGQRYSKQEDLV